MRFASVKVSLFFLILIGIVGLIASKLYPDFLWFQSFGYDAIWWFRVSTEWLSWLLFTAVALLWLGFNAFIAKRNSSKTTFKAGYPINTPFPLLNTLLNNIKANLERAQAEQSMTQRTLSLVVNGIVVFLAIVFGLSAKGWWEDLYLYLNQVPYGMVDPVFSKDISFYLLSLPLFNQIQNWFSGLFIVSIILVGWIYFSRNILMVIFSKEREFTAIKKHLLVLLSVAFLLFGLGTWLSTFDLLVASNGVVQGASYVDVNVIYPLKYTLLALFVLEAFLVLVLIWNSSFKLPYLVLGLILIIQLVGFRFIPNLVESLVVKPNELVKQQPYIEQNIKFTQEAYNINSVIKKDFPATLDLTVDDINDNQTIVDNIRLWNQLPLKSTFSQLQEIRLYYEFENVDVDRYMVNGKPQQVMLSAREMDSNALTAQAQTWINRHLVYTHGYGLCMTPVNKVTEDGLPEFYVKDLPPVTIPDINITRPAIYFGEKTYDYAVVNTKQNEFDYPKGDDNVTTHYSGKGGVLLDSWFKRLVYAFELSELKILLPGPITTESRLMYDRLVPTMVKKIAPFLAFDSDPYLVINDKGELKWMLDAYTLSNKFPYSEYYGSGQQIRPFNYIRNTVKVVVDAYDGQTDFYVVDDKDPIIQAYAKTYKNMFKPIEELSDSLKQHIRYPKGLFSVQASMLNTYHMENVEVFYNREDLWQFPKETYYESETVMSPYYIVTKLPGDKKEKFVLMLPVTPTSKNNLIAWIAVSCDYDSYGQFTVLRLPKEKLVYGPMNIESRIDQDTEISKSLTLWGQSGSSVIRGNLMLIPINNSLLYVEPLYIQAESSQMPELKQVVVYYNDKVVMEDNLTLAILKLFGFGYKSSESTVDQPIIEIDDSSIAEYMDTNNATIDDVILLFKTLKESLSQQRWQEFGATMQTLDTVIQRLESGEPAN